MSDAVSIRSRRDTDLDACVAVLRQVHEHEGYPRGISDFRQFLSSSNIPIAWIAELDGKVVGHIAVGLADDDDLAVRVWRQTQTQPQPQPQHEHESHHPDSQPTDIAILQRLFVLPEARKRGAAARLVEAAVAHEKARGVRLLLFVLEANQAAKRLYLNLGWEVYGTSTFQWDADQEMEATCLASPV